MFLLTFSFTANEPDFRVSQQPNQADRHARQQLTMLSDIGIYSYLTPAVAFFLLTILLVISWRGQALATLAVVASFASTIWAATALAYSATPLVPTGLYQLAELVRTGLWCLFLLNMHEDMRQSQQALWRNI